MCTINSNASSHQKGETLEDTMRVVEAYVNAARLAATTADVSLLLLLAGTPMWWCCVTRRRAPPRSPPTTWPPSRCSTPATGRVLTNLLLQAWLRSLLTLALLPALPCSLAACRRAPDSGDA